MPATDSERGTYIGPADQPYSLHGRSIALEERNLRVQSKFALDYGAKNALLRVVGNAVASQHQEGSWGSDDAPRTKPSFTAQTIIVMWLVGIRFDVGATDVRERLGPASDVMRAASWLETVQQEDGGWAEDAWDTCHVLEALRLCGYTASQECISRGLRLVRRWVDADWSDRSSYWYGAGFCGAAMTLFNAYGDTEYATKTLSQVWRYWDDEQNCFEAPDDRHTVQRAPAEWHTASAIIGLRSFGFVSPRPERVDLACEWLRGRQRPEGCWSPGHPEISCSTTKQVIVALSPPGYDDANSRAADRGTKWLLEQAAPDGPLSVRLLAAAAIVRTHPDELVAGIPFVLIQETNDLLISYRALASTLVDTSSVQLSQLEDAQREIRRRDAELRAERKRYAIRITDRQLAVLSIVLTIVTFALGIGVAFLLGA